ncbi:MAG TPA: ABC transporter permease [Phototrophicaceae bacterium]|nr:ABC transporter permease [Phototrophicaceae bacterium]
MKLRLSISDLVIALTPIIAVLLAFVAGAVLLVIVGADPIKAYGSMIDGAFGNQANLLRTLTRATPLLIIAVGICIAFRAGVINIGAEGQVFIGAIAAAAFSLGIGSTLPAPLLAPLTVLTGFIAGAIWGGIPGFLKARFGVNEILSTVMMNEIATQLLLYLLAGPLLDPAEQKSGTLVPQTAQIPNGAWLARLAPPSQVHIGLFIGLVMAVLVYLLLWRTPLGYRIRAVGLNKDASRYAGISVPLYIMLALVLSGGLAGMAGAVELTGINHRVVEGFAVGYGFSGIVVALFGRLHPLGAIPSAFLFGALLVGADRMQRTMQVPSATVTAIEGLVVIFVVSSDFFVRRYTARRKAREVSTVMPEVKPVEATT